jgi:hypothetical protein
MSKALIREEAIEKAKDSWKKPEAVPVIQPMVWSCFMFQVELLLMNPRVRLKSAKRIRSNVRASSAEPAPSKRVLTDATSKTRGGAKRPMYSDVVKSVGTGIKTSSFPERELTENNFNQIKKELGK